jgi:hypothetical protein
MPLSRAYIAGVFDSDGSFSIVRHKRIGSPREFDYRVVLQLTWREVPQTVLVLTELKRKYGGSVIRGIERHGFSKQTRYVKYRIDARNARGLIIDILPHLRVKRKQAELCLKAALILSQRRYGRWNPRPEEEWLELERLHEQVGFLNWKNGKGRKKSQRN